MRYAVHGAKDLWNKWVLKRNSEGLVSDEGGADDVDVDELACVNSAEGEADNGPILFADR